MREEDIARKKKNVIVKKVFMEPLFYQNINLKNDNYF